VLAVRRLMKSELPDFEGVAKGYLDIVDIVEKCVFLLCPVSLSVCEMWIFRQSK